MKRLLLLILCGLATTTNLSAEEIPLPNPPTGQILDRSQWLGSERIQSLEHTLRRYRTDFSVDILVVIWDRELPEGQNLHDMALELGTSWAREELWAIIMTPPDPVSRPEIHYGGIVAEAIDPESLDVTVQEAVERGLKDWTDQARIEAVAMEIGEEFVYLQQRRTKELTVVRERVTEFRKEKTVSIRKKIFRTVLGILGTLVTLGTTAFLIWHFRRQHLPYQFPETHWRRRFGGDWSGGSTVSVSLPSSQS